ncbi:MAG: histidinol dehydrogenase [Treponema sp.]|jgi:histidinol dehydrogenase|nr:histidinol dehydrogenase [Treponema sp.]
MKIIHSSEFDSYWKNGGISVADEKVSLAVREIIAAVRKEGDAAVRRYASRFDKSSPGAFQVSADQIKAGYRQLREGEPALAVALETSADHIERFAQLQKAQFADFEYEMAPGLITGQRVIPVQRAAVYVPAGRFPLISSVLMGVIPARVAGVEEAVVASPPLEAGLPDWRILAAAHLAGANRVFAIGGAQAIAALALGTETVPRVDVIVGPGNKYVAAAKQLLFGEVGIDFIAGPTDVLIITDSPGGSEGIPEAADLMAADMLAQAEHDSDARARALVPCRVMADQVARQLEARLARLPTASTAKASLDAGGLIIIYDSPEAAIRIADTIAPEHLELHVKDTGFWVPKLKNYGSLFIGSLAVEALGDYSAGINHTLPTSGSARFTGGLSVRHFLKALTTLRCSPGRGWQDARSAAEQIAEAEGLAAHRESVASREQTKTVP